MNIIYTKNRDEILVDADVYLWASKIAWHLDKDGYVTHAHSRADRDSRKSHPCLMYSPTKWSKIRTWMK